MEKSRQKLRTALEACPAYPILDTTTLEIHAMSAWITAIAGAGIRIIQLRLKESTDTDFYNSGYEFVQACRSLNVLSIINDRVDIALATGADGVHLGLQDDLITDARSNAMNHPKGGSSFIVGGSARCVERAKALTDAGASYLGCGACYPTETKSDAVYIGLEKLSEVAHSVNIPVVGIGGITWQNYHDVLDAGAAGFAAITMFQLDLKEIALNIALTRKSI